MQPQIGPLIAGLLPRGHRGRSRQRDLGGTGLEPGLRPPVLSCMHSDFDRARQISHYWRRRGAETVIGGAFASSYPDLCQPFFDAVVVGTPSTRFPPCTRIPARVISRAATGTRTTTPPRSRPRGSICSREGAPLVRARSNARLPLHLRVLRADRSSVPDTTRVPCIPSCATSSPDSGCSRARCPVTKRE